MSDVSLRGVGKVFPDGFHALRDIDLSVADGELLVVVGPSGSGKSTILRVIAGLIDPTEGSVWIGGRDVTRVSPRYRNVSLTFQNPALYPHLSVFKNMAFGLRARGLARPEIRSRVESAASNLGLGGMLQRRPRTLSGGQLQRVALGRAFSRQAAVSLLDEPMSSLDGPLRAAIRADLIALHQSLGSTMIYVTHDQAEALVLGDRLAVLESGRLIQSGSPSEIYQRPAHRTVAEFIGDPPMSVLRGRLINDSDGNPRFQFDGLTASMPISSRPRIGAGPIALGVRPEHVTILDADNSNPAGFGQVVGSFGVKNVAYQGHDSIVEIGFGPQTVRSRCKPGHAIRRGDPVSVAFAMARASWFGIETGARVAD